MERNIRIRKIVLTALFAAMAVLLSGIHFPIGPAKVFPFQHTINCLAGVLIGPWYGGMASLIAGLIRNALGTGTIFALPGGIPGAIAVGLVYHWLRKDWASFAEPIGTGFLGVFLIVIFLGPLMGRDFAFLFFFSAFMASSIPGSLLGYFLLRTIRKAKILDLSPVPKS